MTNEMPVPTQSTNQVDPLAERYRAAFDKITRAQTLSQTARTLSQTARAEWIEATIELGEVILEARRQYPDTNAYSRWLVRNDLRIMTSNEIKATAGCARDPEAGRKMLQASTSYKVRTIWESVPKRGIGTLTQTGKGTKNAVRRGSHLSGHAQRQRRRVQRIPDVMQDQPPRPQPAAVVLKGKTREEVDPDFKGTDLQFATKYQHVNLHTKDEIERSKRQDVLQKWLGTGTAFGAATPPDQATLAEWAAKPGRAARVSDLQAALRQAADLLETVCPKPKEQIATSSDLLSDECPDRHSLND